MTASIPVVDLKRNILLRTIYSPISYTHAVMDGERPPTPDEKSPVLIGLIKTIHFCYSPMKIRNKRNQPLQSTLNITV